MYRLLLALTGLALVGAALLLVGVTIATIAPYKTDARCMALIASNRLALDSREADWLANYHGCQQTYSATGKLTGYGRGTGYCNRLAYQLALVERLDQTAMHKRIAGRCVLHEDWSWSRE